MAYDFGSYATFLVCVAILATLIAVLGMLSSIIQQWVSDEGGNADKHQRASDNERQEGDQLPGQRVTGLLPTHIDAVADAIKAYHNKRDIQERRKSKNDKINIVGLSVTAAFAFIAAGAGVISAWIFNRQLEETRSESRPWIRIGAVEPADLTWIPEKWRVSVPGWGSMAPKITVSNVGKSPAFAVQAAAWGFVGQKADGESILNRRRQVCHYLKDGDSPRGKILFPGEDATPTHDGWGVRGLVLSKEDIEKAETISNTEGKPTFTLYIVGCADYMFGSPLEHHQTYFWFSVVRKVAAASDMQVYDGRFYVGQDVSADQLVFLPLEAGNDAN